MRRIGQPLDACFSEQKEREGRDGQASEPVADPYVASGSPHPQWHKQKMEDET